MTHANLKLCIDLIPKTCSGQNLRNQMKTSQWDELRNKVYADAGNICWVCGAKGRLNCHETWTYDDERRIQKLTGFHAICNMCNFVTHFGFAQILASKDKLDIEAVIQHFLKINGVGRDEFDAHKTEAFRLRRERSTHEWQTDLGEWASLVDQNNADPAAQL